MSREGIAERLCILTDNANVWQPPDNQNDNQAADNPQAVAAASPQMLREMPDFTHLYSKVLSLLMIVMIYKAEAWTNWQLFGEMETERANRHSRLALYIFFVCADAWRAVCEKLKIDADAIREMMFPNCFLFQRIAFVDEIFREPAFTETEARKFVGWFAGEEKFAMTPESKIKEFCAFLELPQK